MSLGAEVELLSQLLKTVNIIKKINPYPLTPTCYPLSTNGARGILLQI
ncbi:MAG: hypothetical protein RML10_12585 [Geminocystis sp.]|nr:hypothetical protein [Geminocystis sp.]MDW8464383.1 hypothetical protein [Geminocystis sp.]